MTQTADRATPLPTSLVGSYAQPDWLIDRSKLAGRFPPRVRARELWRVAAEYLEEAQDDATLLAIRAQEAAGLDIITDGEIRRESYSNHFATALDGVDIDNPGTALDRSGHPNPVPRIAGPIRRTSPIEVDDVRFLRARTDHVIKMTVPGPFTMSQQAQNDYYPDLEAAAMDYAAAVNAEIKDLHAAGADIVQIDEPYMQARPTTRVPMASPPSTPPSTVSPGQQQCISASAMPRSSMLGPRVTHSCPSSPAAQRTRSPSRRPNPASTSACSPISPTKPSSWVSSTCPILRSRPPRLSRRGSAGRSRTRVRTRSSSEPIAA